MLGSHFQGKVMASALVSGVTATVWCLLTILWLSCVWTLDRLVSFKTPVCQIIIILPVIQSTMQAGSRLYSDESPTIWYDLITGINLHRRTHGGSWSHPSDRLADSFKAMQTGLVWLMATTLTLTQQRARVWLRNMWNSRRWPKWTPSFRGSARIRCTLVYSFHSTSPLTFSQLHPNVLQWCDPLMQQVGSSHPVAYVTRFHASIYKCSKLWYGNIERHAHPGRSPNAIDYRATRPIRNTAMRIIVAAKSTIPSRRACFVELSFWFRVPNGCSYLHGLVLRLRSAAGSRVVVAVVVLVQPFRSSGAAAGLSLAIYSQPPPWTSRTRTIVTCGGRRPPRVIWVTSPAGWRKRLLDSSPPLVFNDRWMKQ